MAALYGRLDGQSGQVTRCGSKSSGVRSRLETWEGNVTTWLEADGTVKVYIGQKGSTGTLVYEGNVDKWREVMEASAPVR